MFSQDWRRIQGGRAHRGSIVQAPLVLQGGWTRPPMASPSPEWVCAPLGGGSASPEHSQTPVHSTKLCLKQNVGREDIVTEFLALCWWVGLQ